MNSNRSRERGLIKFLFFMVIIPFLAVAGAYFSHVVKTEDAGLKFYLKSPETFKDSYVDLTELSVFDLNEHRPLVIAMEKAGDLKYLPSGQIFVQAGRFGVSAASVLNKLDTMASLTGNKEEGLQEKASRKAEEVGSVIREKYDVYSEEFKKQTLKLKEWVEGFRSSESR